MYRYGYRYGRSIIILSSLLGPVLIAQPQLTKTSIFLLHISKQGFYK